MNPTMQTAGQVLLAVLAVVLTLVGAFFARGLMTPRAWWLLVSAIVLALVGLLGRFPPLVVIGLAIVGWFGAERLRFALLVHLVLPRLRVSRQVRDAKGPVHQLWTSQAFEVLVTVELPASSSALGRWFGWLAGLPHVSLRERQPFNVKRLGPLEAEDLLSGPRADGPLQPGQPLQLSYGIHCPTVGQVRFEGVRLLLADLQGFFSHAAFVHAPEVRRVLPRLVEYDWRLHSGKRINVLPPPGIHRLKQAGSSSELLDLRDYLPGDPPKTIAWKVSARRDRLITKEFESEAPLRCALFLDASTSVRLGGPDGTPLQRLIEIAVAVLRANTAGRDLTGLALFDEQVCTIIRPARDRNHVTRLLHTLTDAANRTPCARTVDPYLLLPLAYAFAEEIYPQYLHPEVNAMPWWISWIASFPGSWRRRVGLIRYLHRRKLDLLRIATFVLPLGLSIAGVAAGYLFLAPPDRGLLLVLTWAASFLVLLGALAVVALTLLLSDRERLLAAWRKRLAALLAVRYGGGPGGLEAMLEDDDLFGLHLQRLLADHQVPYSVPLYDEQGRYLFAAPEKIAVLSQALTAATSRGRDNELFVLLADLAELDEQLDPLLRAVRVALGRHHQVVLVCPWPAGMELPEADGRPQDLSPEIGAPQSAAVRSYQAAYQRVRRRFAALGVPVVCAASDEATALILQRMDRLRGVLRRL